jgi:cell division protein FtsX
MAAPLLVTGIGVFFKTFALYAITRIFLALGLSYWVITGFDDVKTNFENEIVANFSSLPLAVYQIMGIAGVDVAITILFSCITVRMIMNGLANGVIGGIAFKGISGAAS